MKFSLSLIAATAAITASGVAAFPSYATDELLERASENPEKYSLFLEKVKEFKEGKVDKRDDGRVDGKNGYREIQALLDPSKFKYNANEQYIDLESDEHKFIAPGPGDIRGPCPGLNLLANHGYLNRNGVTTLTQGIDAIGKVFGVEVDLGLALNAYAVVFNGNLLDTTWSIGGKYASDGLGGLTNLLVGEPAGINAHNVYEGDASIVRQDYYLPGAKHDNVLVHLPYFQELLDQGGNNDKDGEDVFTPTVMLKHKASRWHHSVENNPLFFNSAFGGLVVTTAAERFVAEFAANNTVDENGNNRIYLDEKNLLAFFSVKKSKTGKLTYTPGHERLLPSWRRRPLGSTFGLDDIVLTLLHAAAIDPSLLSVGGNTGKVNSFAGVDVGDLTGGVFNVVDLLGNPQALACYLYQIGVEELIPTQLDVIYKTLGGVLDFVGQNIAGPWKKLATAGNNPCKSLQSNIEQSYKKFPGSKPVRK